MIERSLASWTRLVAHRDKRANFANRIAMLIAFNQPFYPVYVYGSVSSVILPACMTFLSTPFFAAVPKASRYNALFGRVLLICAGLGNTLLCHAVFGPASGIDAFLFPCLVLTMLLFRRSERLIAFGFVGAAFAIYLVPDGTIPGPLHAYGADELAALRRLNFLSAAGLTVMIPLLFVGSETE